MANNNSERKWWWPNKRAKSYAESRKKGVHTGGPKKGQKLDDYEKGLRSGYLMAQNDNAGAYSYCQARREGMTKEQALDVSKAKGFYAKK